MAPKFIKVHYAGDNKLLRLNVNEMVCYVKININDIEAYREVTIGRKEFTRIIIGKGAAQMDVTETPEEIDDLIEKAQRGY